MYERKLPIACALQSIALQTILKGNTHRLLPFNKYTSHSILFIGFWCVCVWLLFLFYFGHLKYLSLLVLRVLYKIKVHWSLRGSTCTIM